MVVILAIMLIGTFILLIRLITTIDFYGGIMVVIMLRWWQSIVLTVWTVRFRKDCQKWALRTSGTHDNHVRYRFINKPQRNTKQNRH